MMNHLFERLQDPQPRSDLQSPTHISKKEWGFVIGIAMMCISVVIGGLYYALTI